jgi:hypothetical protein
MEYVVAARARLRLMINKFVQLRGGNGELATGKSVTHNR